MCLEYASMADSVLKPHPDDVFNRILALHSFQVVLCRRFREVRCCAMWL